MTGGVFILLWSSPGYRTPDEERVRKMKRILIVLSALVLIFAVACSGDNPAPGGNSGNSNAPSISIDDPTQEPTISGSADKVMDEALADRLLPILMAHENEGLGKEYEPTYATRYEHFDESGTLIAETVVSAPTAQQMRTTTLKKDFDDMKAGTVIKSFVGGDPSYTIDDKALTSEQEQALSPILNAFSFDDTKGAKYKMTDITIYDFRDVTYEGGSYSRWIHRMDEYVDTRTGWYKTYFAVSVTPGVDGMTFLEIIIESEGESQYKSLCRIVGGADAGTYSVSPDIISRLFG